MRILGLSAFHRDSAAALVVDGKPVAAAQEERFTRKRLDAGFPARSVRYCLDKAGIQARELDRVVFYEKPLKKFERLLASQIKAFPRSAKPFSRSMFLWLGDRLWMKGRIADEVGVPLERVGFIEHQLCHAASAYYPSPFEQAAILSIDDAGEWATTLLARGTELAIEPLAELHFPNSLGLLESTLTQFLGFEPGREEGKVQALAAHGEGRFTAALRELVPAQPGGTFAIDTEAFRFHFDTERLWGPRLEEVLGPPRTPGSPLRSGADDARDADVAASLQELLQERALELAQELHRRTSCDTLCLAGELAANRYLNSALIERGPFRDVYVPPAPDQAGAALGAALYASHAVEGAARPRLAPSEHAGFLGEELDDRSEDGARQLAGDDEVREALLAPLLDDECVGWVRGAMELGPKSLGHRCILARAGAADARTRLLSAVQQSEPYLACRLAMPAERAQEFIELAPAGSWAGRHGHVLARAKDILRSDAPSAVDPQGRVWPQLVDRDADPALHALLLACGERAGSPLLFIADLHLRGAPLARNEADAVDAYRRSGLGAVVVEARLYRDSEAPTPKAGSASGV